MLHSWLLFFSRPFDKLPKLPDVMFQLFAGFLSFRLAFDEAFCGLYGKSTSNRVWNDLWNFLLLWVHMTFVLCCLFVLFRSCSTKCSSFIHRSQLHLLPWSNMPMCKDHWQHSVPVTELLLEIYSCFVSFWIPQDWKIGLICLSRHTKFQLWSPGAQLCSTW